MSLGQSQSADKAPILIYNLKDKLGEIGNNTAEFRRWVMFKKIEGKPGTYGASKPKTNDVFRRGFTLD